MPRLPASRLAGVLAALLSAAPVTACVIRKQADSDSDGPPASTTDATTGVSPDPTAVPTTDPTDPTTDLPPPTTGPDASSTTGQIPDLPAPQLDLPPAGDPLNGLYLLAISTTLDPSKPLQFLTTAAFDPDGGGGGTLALELQPLSLAPGRVTIPREPVGEPLAFPGIAVADGSFELATGSVMIPAAANPITGSDVTASLVLSGLVQDDDRFCGAVSGMVTEPLAVDLSGSTFAAVRVAGPDALPLDVAINCEGATVTDL